MLVDAENALSLVVELAAAASADSAFPVVGALTGVEELLPIATSPPDEIPPPLLTAMFSAIEVSLIRTVLFAPDAAIAPPSPPAVL